MVKLWIPPNSDFAKNNEWLWENHPPDLRCTEKSIKQIYTKAI